MEHLCAKSQSQVDHIHISAIFSATAKVWFVAKGNHSFFSVQHTCQTKLQVFLGGMCQLLQPVVPQLESRQVSNILWSSAKLGLNLNKLTPGTLASLLKRFLSLIQAPEGRQQPNAQEVTNFLWSLATMGRVPSDVVVETCCARIVQLINSADTAQRPNAQDIANLFWALGTMKIWSKDTAFLELCCTHFEALMHSQACDRPNAQATANVLWGVSRMKATLVGNAFVDMCCAHFTTLIRSGVTSDQPNAQTIANMLWALHGLKHAPKDGIVSCMTDRFMSLSTFSGQNPTAQNISNVFLSCARLRVALSHESADFLVSLLLRMARNSVHKHDICNTAWSLAVLGLLRGETFQLFLHWLSVKKVGDVGAVGLGQLYQALEWLQPSPAADLKKEQGWGQLQARLARLGPRPPPASTKMLYGTKKLCAALKEQRLAFKSKVSISNYLVEAVLQPSQGASPSILVSLQAPEVLNNMPDR